MRLGAELRCALSQPGTRNHVLDSIYNASVKGKARALNVSPSSIRQFSNTVRSSKPATSTSTTTTTTTTAGPLPSSSSSSSNPPTTTTTTTTTTQSAISLLKSQPSHYVLSSINGRVYLLSKSDVITVPHLRNVNVGDVLQLERIHEVGSRNYTLRAQENLTDRKRGLETSLIERLNHGSKLDFSNPNSTLALLNSNNNNNHQGVDEEQGGILETSTDSWSTRLLPNGLAHNGSVLDEEIVSVKVVVLEHTKGKMEKIEKTKRRKGYKKTIKHKGWWTKLRVEGIEIGISSSS